MLNLRHFCYEPTSQSARVWRLAYTLEAPQPGGSPVPNRMQYIFSRCKTRLHLHPGEINRIPSLPSGCNVLHRVRSTPNIPSADLESPTLRHSLISNFLHHLYLDFLPVLLVMAIPQGVLLISPWLCAYSSMLPATGPLHSHLEFSQLSTPLRHRKSSNTHCSAAPPQSLLRAHTHTHNSSSY